MENCNKKNQYIKTEIELIEEFASFYKNEIKGELLFDNDLNTWFRPYDKNQSIEVKKTEVYTEFLSIINEFRVKMINQYCENQINKILKQVFRIHNIDMILSILSMYIKK